MNSEMKRLYWTFAALMVLLAAAMGTNYAPIGPAKLWVSIGIAVAKMLLIALVFMKLSESSGPVRLAAGVGLLMLSIAVACTAADYVTRGWRETIAHDLQRADHVEALDRIQPKDYPGPAADVDRHISK